MTKLPFWKSSTGVFLIYFGWELPLYVLLILVNYWSDNSFELKNHYGYLAIPFVIITIVMFLAWRWNHYKSKP